MEDVVFAVEVGCRGFVGQSLWRALIAMGIKGADRWKLIGCLCRETETAFCGCGEEEQTTGRPVDRMKFQVVPGWDFITPVGAPLEAVVDSAETAEEGGST